MEFDSFDQVRQALEQIDWARHRGGSYSSGDPLLIVQKKLREARNAKLLTVDLSQYEIGLLAIATKDSLNYVGNYDYGTLETAEKQRNETLEPIYDLYQALNKNISTAPIREGGAWPLPIKKAQQTQEPIVDPEFRKIIPPLAKDEYDQLECNIVKDGCRDPLVIWQGIVLDGHNRIEICERHGLPYKTVDVVLPNREAAYNWIIENQLGRRNLTPEAASYLRGKRYQAERITQGTRNQYSEKGQNDPFHPTAQRLAEEYKVSEPTIKRDAAFAQAVDTLTSRLGEDVRQKILSRDAELNKGETVRLAQIANFEPEKAKGLLEIMGTDGVSLNVAEVTQGLQKGGSRPTWWQSSEDDDWWTPQWLFDLLNIEFGFELDVCASPANHKCERYFSREQDGLSQEWIGVCWMNPPYGRTGGGSIYDWIKKAYESARGGSTIVCLVPARTDTAWWWDFCICGEVRFLKGRIKFENSDNSAPFPSAIVVFRPLVAHNDAKVVWWNVNDSVNAALQRD